MISRKLVIFGNGDMAQLADYYFTCDSDYEVCAFTIDSKYLSGESFNGRDVATFETLIETHPPDEYSLFVAIGYSRMNDLRTEKLRAARDMGFSIATYISSRATVFPDLSSSENNFILEDNTIQPYVTIGNNVVLWSGNHIGHHSIIGDNCFITSHVVVSGGVTVGNNTFIGVNSTLHDRLNIAPYTLIGAGSLVNKDTEDYGVYIGSPAEKARIPSTKLRI